MCVRERERERERLRRRGKEITPKKKERNEMKK